MTKHLGRTFFMLFIVGALVFVSLPQQNVMAQSADDETLIRQTIDSYFVLKYQGRATLSPQDFGQLIASGARAQQFLQEETDRREIEYHRASLFQLKYLEYKYTLDVQSIKIDKRSATVELVEGHEVVFEVSASVVSKMGGLAHTFELVKQKGNWKIVEDSYVDSLVAFMDSGVTKAQAMQLNEKQHQEFLSQSPSGNEEQGLQPMSGGYYNASGAVAYAHAHWSGSGGAPKYPDYNNQVQFPGQSDCANFVSQAIHDQFGGNVPYAGGPSGTAGWYIQWPTPYSKSESWAWAQGLSDFIVSSTQQANWPYGGPDGYVTTGSPYPGDVISYDNGTSPFLWDHVALIVANNGAYILITDRSAPSNNHDNYPAMSIFHYGYRFTRVTGY